MQRAVSYFRRRRATVFEALATAISGSDWGVQRLRDLEAAEHPLEYLLNEIPVPAAAGEMRASGEASLVDEMRRKLLVRASE